jgi:hypothetical protein
MRHKKIKRGRRHGSLGESVTHWQFHFRADFFLCFGDQGAEIAPAHR